MDPVTHTFVGASLSASGLNRLTPLATATLVLAVNAPDVDILAQAFGPYEALAWRRGISHGVPALLIWPFIITAVVLAWDRWVRLRLDPLAQSARPLSLGALAALGVWTHPALDWLNTYGMRWWMPLDSTWTYGDAVFIIDPWVWFILGGGLFLLHSARMVSGLLWVILAGAMSILVLGTNAVPGVAKLVWAAGLVAWAIIRLRWGWMIDRPRADGPGPEVREWVARWTLGITTLYLVLMTLQNPFAERVVRAEAHQLGVESIQDLMVGPVPANPFRGEVVIRTRAGYHRGSFAWLETPRLRLEPEVISSHPRDAVVRAAKDHPDAQNFLAWSRFPQYTTTEDIDGWTVRINDVRYMRRDAAGSLSGVTIRVGRDLRILDPADKAWTPDSRRVVE